MGLSIAFHAKRKSGEATLAAIAKNLKVCEKTVRRYFKKPNNPLEIPGQGFDLDALKLFLRDGKIVNLLETETTQKAITE
jgi:transcriptional antiterminator